jgi:3-dehydroquinate synthase
MSLTPPANERRVQVALGSRAYKIIVSAAALKGITQTLIAEVGDLSHALVFADQAVERTFAQPIVTELRNRNIRTSLIQVPAGESSKSIEMLARLWNWMLDEGTDRRSLVLALGGGVVGDLAGFAAASYARGLRVVQLPTTLLAMVDSSVGGKTGINLAGAKNMVGAFWQPSLVVIDTNTLNTLPPREFTSGLAEVIKYGVIDDVYFFEWLESNMAKLVSRDPAALQTAIVQSCQSKARVVGDDERETTGRRAILNYGHTFAHAIEATTGYGTWLHGEAVAIGMQMAARLAVNMGRVPEAFLIRQTALLVAAGLPIELPGADANSMLEVMRRDKKVEHGKLRLILPSRLGHVELVGGVEPDAILQSILAKAI